MINYKNLDLRVRGDALGGYTVEVIGPEGEQASAPLDRQRVSDLDADLEAIRSGGLSTMERVGSALFEALFPMDVRMVYVAAEARLAENEGLRLRLQLPAELAPLPWELLYYRRYYLAADPRSPVVRYLALPDAPRPLTVRPPLRLLHLIASPMDAPPLDAEREADLLRTALHDQEAKQRVEILPGRPGSLATLRDGLQHGCHVLHFTGHGTLSAGVGYLLFEDEGGRGQPVDSGTLAQLLRGTSTRLAFLNACESAAAADGNAFGSVAAALIEAGLPAVVAHTQAMPDRSAIPFAAGFYRALAHGYPVDAAVGEGRKAIISDPDRRWRERMDWAIPALLMRAPDGRILTPEEPEEATQGAAPRPSTVVEMPVTVQRDAATVGHISGGEIYIAFGAEPAEKAAPAPDHDPLPDLLAALRETVRQYANPDMRTPALAQVATLSSAALQAPPDLDGLETALGWFRAEAPQLSGAVLNAIAGVRGRAAAAGQEFLCQFEDRFGPFPD